MSEATTEVQAEPWETFEGLPDIFRECVVPDESIRFNLRWPYLQDDFVYATDGRILVRIAADLVPDAERFTVTEDRGRVPKESAKAFENSGPWEASPTFLPFPKGTERLTCDHCLGKGKGLCTCCGVEHECQNCDGTGGYPNREAVEVGPGWFATCFLYILFRAGVREVYLSRDRKQASRDSRGGYALRFVTGDVEGVLMGLIQD